MATKTALLAEINTNYPDNTIGAITPALLRTTSIDELNSWQQAPQVNSQTGVSYVVTTSDYGQMVLLSNAAPVAVSLPAATTIGFSPFNVMFKNNGAGLVTVTPVTGTIDGVASLAFATGQTAWVVSDGTNWRTGIITSASGAPVSGGAVNQVALFGTSTAITSGVAVPLNQILVGTGAAPIAVPPVGDLSLSSSPFPGTFTINSNFARLNLADQLVTGGANVTALALTSGNVTIDCGARPLQFIANNAAFNITAPVNDGSCMLKVTNGGGAGAVNFIGFTVNPSNVGDAITLTPGAIFTISIWRIGGTSGYRVAAHQ